MASRRPLARLEHVRDELVELGRLAESLTAESFAASYLHRRAVEHAVLIISEAVRALPADLTDRHPGPRWADIRGIGNVLRHDYFAVEPAILWNILTVHLPPLASVVEAMMADVRTGDDGSG